MDFETVNAIVLHPWTGTAIVLTSFVLGGICGYFVRREFEAMPPAKRNSSGDLTYTDDGTDAMGDE